MALPLNQISGMPQMYAAFQGWRSTITVETVTQRIINGLVQDTKTPVSFKGVIQPLKPQEIALKPEGQRSWEWLWIHCLRGPLNLLTNDKIIYNSKEYKVMAVKDYSLNNYIEYHLVADYAPGRNC
jgi:hypothetical protein